MIEIPRKPRYSLICLTGLIGLLSAGCPPKQGNDGDDDGNGGGGTGIVHEISIKNFAFSNLNLTIAVGDTVRWTNQDLDVHTVTSGDPDVADPAPGAEFDSLRMLPGAVFEHRFDAAGSFEYHCGIHFMTDPDTMRHAKIEVTP